MASCSWGALLDSDSDGVPCESIAVSFLSCSRAGRVRGATGGKMAMRAGPEWRGHTLRE